MYFHDEEDMKYIFDYVKYISTGEHHLLINLNVYNIEYLH